MKTCRKCSATKDLQEFRSDRKDCRSCEREACRIYATANRPRRNARLSRWRRNNPDKAAAVDRRRHLRANYGLTEIQVETMRKAQGGRCLLCRSDKSLVIDHCHTTGRVRGLLCMPCNTTLGHVEAHPEWIGRATIYLGEPCHADVLLEIANR